MRVISGKARGKRLKSVPGDTTRPIMDRIKENLFNLLVYDQSGLRWLDLFAGTGQVGIEALSRGAESVVFTDAVYPAIKTIQQNLSLTRLEDGATVLKTDAFGYLERFGERPFDIIFIAPPQYKGLWQRALTIIDKRPEALLAETGFVIVQIDPKEYEPVPLQVLQLDDERTYGNTQLLFYEPNGEK